MPEGSGWGRFVYAGSIRHIATVMVRAVAAEQLVGGGDTSNDQSNGGGSGRQKREQHENNGLTMARAARAAYVSALHERYTVHN